MYNNLGKLFNNPIWAKAWEEDMKTQLEVEYRNLVAATSLEEVFRCQGSAKTLERLLKLPTQIKEAQE